MAAKIRLKRVGRKGQPSYRVVVLERAAPQVAEDAAPHVRGAKVHRVCGGVLPACMQDYVRPRMAAQPGFVAPELLAGNHGLLHVLV